MVKKVNQASVKISKDEKQNFNSLIKVLKPKVYITDSSSFKKLVQELTGNGNSTTFSPPTLEPNIVEIENSPLILQGSFVPLTFQPSEVNSSLIESTSSFDASVSTTEETNNSSESSYDALMNEEFNHVCNQLYLDDDSVFQDSVVNQPFDQFLAFKNIESLLFDVEENYFYNCYEQFELPVPDVSIYDYELSGLL